MSHWQVLILSLIEGLTEFLPVSSTGHLIFASAFMGIKDENFLKCFNVIIQFGAIFAVLVLYWRRFLPNIPFYKKLVIAVMPAVVIGLLLKHKIDMMLESVLVVGWALLIGGIILILTDKYLEHKETSVTIDTLSWKQCLQIGLFQCLAMIPGTSRSGATIVGGMTLGLNRKDAAEFSFFLAVPTMAGATFLQTIKLVHTVASDQWMTILWGTILSFIFALVTIHLFLPVIIKFGYKYFGIYRIIIGATILIMAHNGLI